MAMAGVCAKTKDGGTAGENFFTAGFTPTLARLRMLKARARWHMERSRQRW